MATTLYIFTQNQRFFLSWQTLSDPRDILVNTDSCYRKVQHKAMQYTEHHFVSSSNITTIIVIIIVGFVKGALQTAKRQWGIYGAPQVTPEVNHQDFI